MYEPQEQEILSITLFTVNFDNAYHCRKVRIKKEKEKTISILLQSRDRYPLLTFWQTLLLKCLFFIYPFIFYNLTSLGIFKYIIIFYFILLCLCKHH